MENFDELAVNWDNEPRRVERAKAAADLIRERIPGLDSMEGFEYGCGTGLFSFNLQPYLNKVWLADSSEGMLKVLQEKVNKYGLTNMEPILTDLTVEKLVGFKCDLIYTLMTLHHIQDTLGILVSFYELLKPQGYLCIVDLDKEDGSFHEEGFIGHNGFDRKELSNCLEKIGYEVIFNEIFYNNVKLDSAGKERAYPLFMMICRKR